MKLITLTKCITILALISTFSFANAGEENKTDANGASPCANPDMSNKIGPKANVDDSSGNAGESKENNAE